MLKEELFQELKEYFSKKEEVKTVYLFGSVAKDKERKNSDLDLAILFQPELDQVQRFELKLEIANDLEEKLKKQVDVVDMKSADLYFIHQIMKNKILIIDKDMRNRVDFEVNYRRDFFDRQRFYRLYHGQVRKRLKERC